MSGIKCKRPRQSGQVTTVGSVVVVAEMSKADKMPDHGYKRFREESMSTPIWDHTQDVSGSEFHRLTSLFPPPAFVKEASHERLFGEGEIPAHLYGDQLGRRYPCHSSAATWASALFLFDKQAGLRPQEFEQIETRLLAQADYFGIGSDVRALKEKVAAIADDADARLPDEAFALVWTGDGGIKERRWPLRNAAEVKVAAEYFAKYRDEFTFSDRHIIANKVLDAASQYGASLGGADDILEKAAGRGGCATAHVAEAFEQRALMARRTHPALSDEVLKLANIVRAAPQQARGHDNLVKFAGLLDQFDRSTGLSLMYDDGGLSRPEEIFFQVTEKAASEFICTHVPTTTGRVYELETLEKISVEQYRDWLGDEFADAVSAAGLLPDRAKIAAVLPTMDRGMAATFDRMADALAIAPVAQEKAAAQGALSGHNLFAQAAKYQPTA